MLSEKAKKQLEMFLTIVKEETGVTINNLSLWQHNHIDNVPVELVNTLQTRYDMTRREYDDYGTISKQLDDILPGVGAGVYVSFPLDVEPEFEQEPFLCKECGDPVQENADDENADFCNVCFQIKLKEWQAESKHLKTEYRQSVI